ncbi:unnamed protein product [Phaedon cochleariae]|uniref:Double jelly roll-like domain-containing protein n=1 Tax=Phaedon cochleariae TaxID=80249 RepID=A0A9N9SIR8_PHACE|nr:unnamed protein product [Phaedon cochleariae]
MDEVGYQEAMYEEIVVLVQMHIQVKNKMSQIGKPPKLSRSAKIIQMTEEINAKRIMEESSGNTERPESIDTSKKENIIDDKTSSGVSETDWNLDEEIIQYAIHFEKKIENECIEDESEILSSVQNHNDPQSVNSKAILAANQESGEGCSYDYAGEDTGTAQLAAFDDNLKKTDNKFEMIGDMNKPTVENVVDELSVPDWRDDEEENLSDVSSRDGNNKMGIPITESVVGNMKDEFPDDPIISFYGTGAKAYYVQSLSSELKKAKGVSSLHEHTYKPYGSPSFKNSDEIRIAVNFQDLLLDISESYIYIEGKFTPNDPTKTCYLSNNALAFLFDEIRYEMGGEQVCMILKPGITTTMKSMISHSEVNAKSLETVGWGLENGKQCILDEASRVFSGKLPLKYLMGFAEDYKKAILNIKQELILIIARSFKNSYMGEVDAALEINKIEWKIRHVAPSDEQELKLLNRLNRSTTARVKIAYRMWDLYELPTIRETASDIWAVKTTNSLERPRFIIIGFQNSSNTDDRSKDVTQFTHEGVNNIRLYLNSEVYPYERWNLDFDKKLDAHEDVIITQTGRKLNSPHENIYNFQL